VCQDLCDPKDLMMDPSQLRRLAEALGEPEDELHAA
jgi:hypothetical protein